MELVLIVLFVVALATAVFFASKEHKTSGSLRQAEGSVRQMEISLQQVNGELKRALDANGGLCHLPPPTCPDVPYERAQQEHRLGAGSTFLLGPQCAILHLCSR